MLGQHLARWEKGNFQKVGEKWPLRGASGQLGPEGRQGLPQGEVSTGEVGIHGHMGVPGGKAVPHSDQTKEERQRLVESAV